MKIFIAYFDYLGFKDFIENNSEEEQKRIILNNFRDMERARSINKYTETQFGMIADTTRSKINCINFSDTIVFWTKDDSIDSLKELLSVSFTFNLQSVLYFFPVRGAIVYGEMTYHDFSKENENGAVFNINSVFGKGLVRAHLKADAQNWAGTVIDSSLTTELNDRGIIVSEFLAPVAKLFKVPYKKHIVNQEEYVCMLTRGEMNQETFKNLSETIDRNFKAYNKKVDDQSVQDKLKNTIEFLESFLPSHA